MITKTFICDICKKSVGETELHSITIQIKNQKEHYCRGMATSDKDVCVVCLEKKGIMIVTPASEKVQEKREVNQKTLESKLIEILEELGVQFQPIYEE